MKRRSYSCNFVLLVLATGLVGISSGCDICREWIRVSHELEYVNHGCEEQADFLASVEGMGGGVIPLDESRFYIAWFPEGWEELPDRRLVVTLHGSGGCAERLFEWWWEMSVDRRFALVALQYAEEDPSGELIYDDSDRIYEDLRTMIGQLQSLCFLGDIPIILHGFSMGSARSFELAIADRADGGMRAFSAFIADSGTAFAETGGELPQFILDAGPNAYDGARFWLYCGGADHDGQTCFDMEDMNVLILDRGAVVDDFYVNPLGGHGIFAGHTPGAPGPALTAMFDYIDGITVP